MTEICNFLQVCRKTKISEKFLFINSQVTRVKRNKRIILYIYVNPCINIL